MPPIKPDAFVAEMSAQARWSGDSACQGEDYDPAWWDTRIVNHETEITSETNLAVNVCLECPVMMSCLRHAVTYRINQGIWGGMTPEERVAWAEREALVAA